MLEDPRTRSVAVGAILSRGYPRKEANPFAPALAYSSLTSVYHQRTGALQGDESGPGSLGRFRGDSLGLQIHHPASSGLSEVLELHGITGRVNEIFG